MDKGQKMMLMNWTNFTAEYSNVRLDEQKT
jgi:hypothetical protein